MIWRGRSPELHGHRVWRAGATDVRGLLSFLPMTYGTLISRAALADLLATSSATIRRRIDSGDLPAIYLGEGPRAPLRVASSDVARFLRRGAERHREKAVR